MRKLIYLVIFIYYPLLGISQSKKENFNSITVSTPIIFNNSNGVYYSRGNRMVPNGKSLSFGLNFNFNKQILKNFFATLGIGYFKQTFKNNRPFNFDGDSITNLRYYTKKYNYHCVSFTGGLGCFHSFNSKFTLGGSLNFTLNSSFSQSYVPNAFSGYQNKTKQINSNFFEIGSVVSFVPSFNYLVSRNISLGTSLIMPLHIKWNYDKIFEESSNYYDSQIIAENKFSAGISFSCTYHF